jgi:hypothetical protein
MDTGCWISIAKAQKGYFQITIPLAFQHAATNHSGDRSSGFAITSISNQHTGFGICCQVNFYWWIWSPAG